VIRSWLEKEINNGRGGTACKMPFVVLDKLAKKGSKNNPTFFDPFFNDKLTQVFNPH
jgi:hypothetical protein